MPLNQTINVIANTQAAVISQFSFFGSSDHSCGNCRAQIHVLAKLMKGFIPPTENTGAVP